MKELITFLTSLLIVLFFGVTVSAQTPSLSPEDAAAKYGVTFPIEELGNCESYDACRTFCEDPVNHNACIDFAKEKGFYQEGPIKTNKDEILATANAELGCDSETSCMALCSEPANFDKCSAFAERHGLGGGHVADPSAREFLARAKEVLGCDSPTSCMNFCNNEANRQKCSEFAQQVGLRGGEHQAGPGGCTSEETCRAFCSDPQNFQICKGFQAGVGEQFSGPGGCNSESSCKEYCQNNPQACGYVGGAPGVTPSPGYSLQEMCNRTPNCAWNGTTCQCAGHTQPAEQSPTTYSPTPGSQYSPQPNYTPQPGTYDPATECSKTPGCSWTGSSCQCSPTTTTSTPPPTESNSSGTYSPAPESSPTVHGAATEQGLLQLILNWLLGSSN